MTDTGTTESRPQTALEQFYRGAVTNLPVLPSWRVMLCALLSRGGVAHPVARAARSLAVLHRERSGTPEFDTRRADLIAVIDDSVIAQCQTADHLVGEAVDAVAEAVAEIEPILGADGVEVEFARAGLAQAWRVLVAGLESRRRCEVW